MRTNRIIGLGLLGLALSALGACWLWTDYSQGMGEALAPLTRVGASTPSQHTIWLPLLMTCLGLAGVFGAGLAFAMTRKPRPLAGK